MASKRYEEGIKIRRRVLGDDYVDRALAKSKGNPLTEELQTLVTESAWGGIWARPGLELKTRSMLNLAILTALNRPHEFEIHMRGAINNGVTKEETKEILLQCAGYCGWPAAIDSFRIADRLFAEAEAAG
jgi:4-carboxymuconolactone decarboxylase